MGRHRTSRSPRHLLIFGRRRLTHVVSEFLQGARLGARQNSELMPQQEIFEHQVARCRKQPASNAFRREASSVTS
jgi:hypothetical protein